MAVKKEKVFDENGNEVRISPRTGKPMKKPRGGNSPVIGDNGLNLEPGDNTKFMKVSLHWFNATPINVRDPIQLEERINEYFQYMMDEDVKPTVAGLAMALGTSRQVLWAWKTGNPAGTRTNPDTVPKECTVLIKKAYFLLENMWENYMLNGRVNPMSGVFLGINNFGYQDTKRIDIAPAAQEEKEEYSVDDIKSRFIIDSEKVEE